MKIKEIEHKRLGQLIGEKRQELVEKIQNTEANGNVLEHAKLQAQIDILVEIESEVFY